VRGGFALQVLQVDVDAGLEELARHRDGLARADARHLVHWPLAPLASNARLDALREQRARARKVAERARVQKLVLLFGFGVDLDRFFQNGAAGESEHRDRASPRPDIRARPSDDEPRLRALHELGDERVVGRAALRFGRGLLGAALVCMLRGERREVHELDDLRVGQRPAVQLARLRVEPVVRGHLVGRDGAA
jgi:hypothetical protein